MSEEQAGRNGRVTLAALDFLSLADKPLVARIDLAEVHYKGVVYVRALTAGEKEWIFNPPGQRNKKRQARVYADRSMDVDLNDMPRDTVFRFLGKCMVTDRENGRILEDLFEQAGMSSLFGQPEDEPTPVDVLAVDEGILVQMWDVWLREMGDAKSVNAQLEKTPNPVASLVARRVREISGLDDDGNESEVDKKK